MRTSTLKQLAPIVAAGLASLAVSFSGAHADHAPRTTAIRCDRLAMHVTANGRESLAQWLQENQQTFASVVHYSTLCDGGFLSKWFGKYVDRQNDKLIMRKGTRFWAQWPQ